MRLQLVKGGAIILITLSLSHVMAAKSDFLKAKSRLYSPWSKLVNKIKCKIAPTDKRKSLVKPVVLNVQCTYHGEKTVEVSWDENFGRMLWYGQFLLKVDGVETRTKLGLTSNVYPARRIRKLSKGSASSSSLRFAVYPTKIISNIIPDFGKVELQLFVRQRLNNARKIDSSIKLIAVSPKVVLRISR